MVFFQEEIKKLKERGLYRTFNILESAQEPLVRIGGRDFLLFSSNNYLGLANHPKLKEISKKTIDEYGIGAGASRLISGSMILHKKLEEEIARFKKTEMALIFSSGYMANIGTIPALVNKDDVIIIDKLCHASIIDGCKLSKARLQVYPHNDIETLDKVLRKNKHKNKKLIITEGVFSMEGSISFLPKILSLAKEYKALILLDDAHATGVLGNEGRGTCEYFNLQDDSIIQMGTFSKALGSLGGFIAGSKDIIDYLRNKARSFIYSTALPPAVVAASIAALEIIGNEPELREKLWKKVNYLKDSIKELGYDILSSPSQIIPIIIGSNKKVLKFSKSLYKRGILISAIRTPTVPPKTERLRITIMATHQESDLNYLLNALADLKEKVA